MLPASNGAWVTQTFSVLDFKLSSYQPDHQEGDEQLDNQPLPHVKSLRYYLIPIRLMALAVVLTGTALMTYQHSMMMAVRVTIQYC
jgi:hypothetical protein